MMSPNPILVMDATGTTGRRVASELEAVNLHSKLTYTPSPARAEFDVLTAGFGSIQLCL
jgi:uncharacterized protein YbjT (DUF2867 family)